MRAMPATTSCFLSKTVTPAVPVHIVTYSLRRKDRLRTESGAFVFHAVEVHDGVLAKRCGDEGAGGAAGNDGLQLVPAADDAASVAVDELAEGDGHFLFHYAGVVDVAVHDEQLGAAEERV